MSLIEGGNFICYRHDFETDTIDEWNAHCDDGDHFEAGTTLCKDCGETVVFTDLPFKKLGPDGSKGLSLHCEDCESKLKGSVKRSKNKK